MGMLSRFKVLKKSKKFGIIFILFMLVYGLIFISLFYSVSIALFKTIQSIQVPDNYFLVNLELDNLEFRTTFSISNKGPYDLTDFRIELSTDIIYYLEYSDDVMVRDNIFSINIYYGKIPGISDYHGTIEGDQDNFNMTSMNDFWSYANVSKDLTFLIDIKFYGKYYFGMVPFSVFIDDLNPECPNC